MKKFLLFFVLYLTFARSGLCQAPGQELWHVTAPGVMYSSPAISPDGTIYVGTDGRSVANGTPGSLCSFSPLGGTNWVLNFSAPIDSSPSIGPDGRIYAATIDGLVAIANPTGSYSTVETGGSIFASPAIGSDGTVYVCSISNFFNKLFALSPDGAVNWVFNMRPVSVDVHNWISFQASSPAIGPQGTIYVGSIDSNLYSISPAGTTNWVFPLDAATYASPAIGPDGTIYIGAQNGIAYAINPQGFAKWQVQLSDRPIESTAAISTDGTIYFATLSSQIFALDRDGTQKWVYTGLGEYSGSPALASDGSLYIAPLTRAVLEAVSAWGTNSWRNYLGGVLPQNGSAASPTIGADGTIYITARDRLYALYGTNGLMQSSWPMFRGNPAHTGRVIQRGITNPQLLADGNFGFIVNVETGRTYQVECSTTGLEWGVLTNFVSATYTNHLADLTATNAQSRLYRLRTAE